MFVHRMLEQVADDTEGYCSPVSFTVELRPQANDENGYTGFMAPTEQVPCD